MDGDKSYKNHFSSMSTCYMLTIPVFQLTILTI